MHSKPFVHLKTHLCIAQQWLLSPNQFALCGHGDGEATVSTIRWGNLTEVIVWLWQSWGGEFLLSLLFILLVSQRVFLWSHSCVWDQLGHPFAVGQESLIWGVHWPDPQGLTPDAHLLGLPVYWKIGQGIKRTKAPALCWDCGKQSISSQLLALVSGCLLK